MACQAVARLRLKVKTGRLTNDMHPKTLEELRTDLALNLRVIRKSKGLAQERLALDAGVDRTVVSKIERGVTNPSLEILLRLANQLDVHVRQLLLPHARLKSGVESQQISWGLVGSRFSALENHAPTHHHQR